MTIDEEYMWRCLQLADNGKGFTSPNPMVGAVIVHEGRIIGEGFHRQYGEPHAEVNAINNVKDRKLLTDSTMYVSLEPCSHYGKTPPCAQLIIDNKIPRVVIACYDPYYKVSGRGVEMLRNAGIEVSVGVLEEEAKAFNKEFIARQTTGRPYIYLKWAQTEDGFIDKIRNPGENPQPTPISNNFSKMLVHKRRAEVSAIMIGTNTAINDNPSLTTRLWYGSNPVRVVLDRNARIPFASNIFDDNVKTIVFTEQFLYENKSKSVKYIQTVFDETLLDNVLCTLSENHIDSLLVEGGRELLQSFINKELWNEAFVEISDIKFGKGVKAPKIEGEVLDEQCWGNSKHIHLANPDNYKFI